FWPVFAGDVLVERLTCAQAECESTRIHRFQCGCRLRQHGWMIAPAGRGNAGHEAHIGRLTKCAEPAPYKRGMPLARNPGMKMVTDGDDFETVLLCELAPLQHVCRVNRLRTGGVSIDSHNDFLSFVTTCSYLVSQ